MVRKNVQIFSWKVKIVQKVILEILRTTQSVYILVVVIFRYLSKKFWVVRRISKITFCILTSQKKLQIFS